MEILILLFTIVIGTAFLCSLLESILLSTNITYISVLEKEYPNAGKLLKKLKLDIDKSIAAILILSTTANTLGAVAIGIQAKNVFEGNSTLIMAISIIFTLIILFFCEIIPKTIGAIYWKQLAIYTPRIINLFIFITYPLIILTQIITKKVGTETHDKISREELLQSTLLSEEEGIIGDLESHIIENTLSLNNKKLKDILTPRSVMYAVDKNSLIKDIIEDKRTIKFSRIPVYEGTIDNIVGIILTKKLFKQAIKEQGISLEDVMKPVFSLHESIHVAKALKLFIQKKEHMFIVHDSYNQTEGIVTLEDCIETLLGLEIMDELDTTADMRKLALNKMKAKKKRGRNKGNVMTFDYENLKLFYIGKEKTNGQNFAPLVYKNKDLTTHAAIIGMTGSGKTGLGISLLEEAAIDNIPSIIIDPKGDMGNLLLTFPNLQGSDFEPWIEEQDAVNNGLSISELALKTAQTWKNGIEADFQNQERIQKLKDSADFTIYTPGSSSGVQISILSSFKAPSIEVLEDNELLVSLINSTVSSILSLIDEKDDSSSKEFILISTIFMNSYSNQKDLSLEELITYIVTPPFSKIGIFDLETFFPQSERLKLALKLNTIIANPSFKSWIEGEPLDISNLLYDESGKAKVSIFSIAHLNDSQRMFFVSLLLNQMVSWMRRQEGTTSLKALLYMDEIFGYFPPNSNPPSKQPMLTLLKQARSFGVGVILSTQNPVDIDYKGLANIGTWFIGRLQTKQDKEKVIDGLSSTVEGKIDKNEMENLLSNLEKRTFIMKNINEDGIKIFQTRWTLSYLKGPITKEQIKFLMANKNINFVSKSEIQKTKIETTNRQNSPKPLIPNILDQKYLYTSQNESYYLQGYLVFKCSVHFVDSAKNIDLTNELNYKVYLQKEASNVNFEELEEFKENSFETNEKNNSNYYETPIFIQNEKELKQIQKDFTDFIFRTTKLSLYKNEDLKIISKQNESLIDFKIRIQDRLNEKIDEQIKSLQEKFSKINDSIDDKLNKLFDKLEKEQLQANTTTTDAIISIGTSLLGAFFGKTTTASTLGKVASSAKGATKILKEKSDVKYVENEIQQLQIEKEELQKTLENEISKINEENKISNFQIEEIFIKPKRTDIFNIKLELLWKEE